MSSVHSDSDAVIIDCHDISNYNPEQILPEPPEVIETLRAWLQPTKYDLENGEYRKHLSSHTPGTGEWIASNSTYTSWLAGHEQGLLWIKGIPGSGKSVLASKIVRDLSQNQPGTPVLYFFFRKIIDANHEPIALLRDWLDQLLLYSPPLQKQIKKYVENKRSLSTMSMESFWTDLRMALSGLHGKAFCIIDALNEMDRRHWTFIRALGELGTWKPHKVKVLMTSRIMPDMEPFIRSLKHSQIQLQSDNIDADISTFVRATLESSKVSPEVHKLIGKAIPCQAHGIFLYAKLAVDAFLKPGADAKEVLKALPQDMSAMYFNLLLEHSRRSGVPEDVQSFILQWATHATRPLSLLEMAETIKVTHSSLASQDLKIRKDMARAACGPLLEILPDETVCVIHHTLIEYLICTNENQSTRSSVLESRQTNARLGLACLSYLQAECLDDASSEKDEPATRPPCNPKRGYGRLDIAEMNLKYPFLAYAASNWHVHLAKSALEGYPQKEINQALETFAANQRLFKTWLEIRWEGKTEGVTPLHVAAKYGLCKWVKHQLTVPGAIVDPVDHKGRSPLFLAAESGREDIVKYLIDAGGNPDGDEKNGLKPLHRAASLNHAGVINVLLGAGVDPLTLKTKESSGNWCGNAPRTKGHTPLMYACHNGHLEAFEAFLPFLHDSMVLHRALAWATERGQEKIVRRILAEPGVDINRKVRGGTPLFRACKSGSAETVLLLLRKGADVTIHCQRDEEFGGCNTPKYDSDSDSDSDVDEFKNTFDPRRRRDLTALYIACERSTRLKRTPLTSDLLAAREVLEAFIECGENIHRRFSDGSTLLHAAKHNTVWTRLLLERSVDPNIADNKGHAPLHDVGNIDNMSQLIENGHADINAVVPSDGKTPLFFLLDRNNPKLTLKLLDYGPDCKAVDKEGNGALHVALGRSKPDVGIIKRLIEAGADPNLRNKSGVTPTDVISVSGSCANEIWDMLLRAGARH